VVVVSVVERASAVVVVSVEQASTSSHRPRTHSTYPWL
jgi:hypothetical protein